MSRWWQRISLATAATKVMMWLLRASLWLAGVGLMWASSGIDGTYIAQLNRWEWAGYVLNAVADITSMVLMYWYGRLVQTSRKETGGKRKIEMSRWVLVVEAIAIFYAWFFGWRQLRGRIYAVETDPLLGKAELGLAPIYALLELELTAAISSGFIPALLVGVGYVQSLLAGRIETEPASSEVKPTVSEPEPFACPHCAATFSSQAGLNAHQRVHTSNNGKHPVESEPERIEVGK